MNVNLNQLMVPLVFLFLGDANASTLRTSAYLDIPTTNNSNGFSCVSSSTSSGGIANCSGTAYYSDSNDTFTSLEYSSKSSSQYGFLKTASSLVYTPGVADPNSEFTEIVPVGELPTFGTNYASASFSDNWIVSGGIDGSQGTIKLVYQLDGTNSTPALNGVSVSSTTSLFLQELVTTDNPFGAGTITTANQSTSATTGFNGSFDSLVELELPIFFGQEFTISMLMTSHSSFDFFNQTPSAFSTNSDFFNTATLDDIQIFDSDGALIAFNLSTESDSQAFESFSSAVPIPSAVWLFGSSLIGLIGMRKRVGKLSNSYA